MIISFPAHTAVCDRRGDGALVVLVAVQLFVVGLYLPPVSEHAKAIRFSTPDDHLEFRSRLPSEVLAHREH